MESRCSREAVVEALREKGPPILIAYSGGVDSALLAALAVRALGKDRVRCVLLDSPLLPPARDRGARETAGRLDLPPWRSWRSRFLRMRPSGRTGPTAATPVRKHRPAC
ncbi:hypothetical protein [Methanoculleus chikugoensis]|uniref:hypothetical protein n=1 Tax=Methanoculleus chikugoensis TaxID=118126 RepID=UPI001FB4616C|nr:hypothetical protein [Methanoculleus chikugoensis]